MLLNKRLLPLIFLCAGCAGEPVSAQTLNARPDSFAAVAKAAKAGQTITLAPGYYGDLALPKADHAQPVTIDAARARIRTLTIRGTSGWRWRGGTITAPPEAFRNVLIDSARRIEITKATITDGLAGVQVIGSQDVSLFHNEVTGMQADGVNVVASQRVSTLR